MTTVATLARQTLDDQHTQFERRMYKRAIDAERDAGRAFLAALDEEDPACSACGCTQMDPCVDEDGDTCGWASREPRLCSFCATGRNGAAPV